MTTTEHVASFETLTSSLSSHICKVRNTFGDVYNNVLFLVPSPTHHYVSDWKKIHLCQSGRQKCIVLVFKNLHLLYE